MHEVRSTKYEVRSTRQLGTCASYFVLAAVYLFLAAPTQGYAQNPGDPLPLRRVLVSPDQLTRAMERVRQGALAKLSRDEFEARVARAAAAGEALKNPPRLIAARYRATLDDSSLVGTAEWTILHAATGAGVLIVQPLNLALKQVRLDEAEAVLGELEGKTLGLLLERGGEQTATLGWSSRGDSGPGGLHFDLQVPACAMASFELDLPADAVLTGARDVVHVSGPLPADTADRRCWRVECSGRTKIDLMVRRATAASRPPLILARIQTRQELTPDVAEVEYEFQLDVAHGGVRELAFVCDAGLRPYEVSLRGPELASWEHLPGPSPAAPSLLRVRLREPAAGPLPPLRLRCQAWPADGRWQCPGMRLDGAVSRGETITLRVPSEVRLEDWRPGSFLLARAATEATGTQVLTLTGSGPSRPGARIVGRGSDWHARIAAWWEIGADHSTLTVQADAEVVAGRLFRLPWRLPPGWVVEQVELDPPTLLRRWDVITQTQGKPILAVELQRALEASGKARLSARLRPARSGPPAVGVALPLPEVLPEGGQLQTGIMAVSIDPAYQATRTPPPSPGQRTVSGSAVPRPWGSSIPDYFYLYKDSNIPGTLRLDARPARVRATCAAEVVLLSGRGAVRERLTLQPGVGNVDTVDVALSTPAAAWGWKVIQGNNQVLSFRPVVLAPAGALAALGTNHPFAAASLFVAAPAGDVRRLRLARPLREPLTLEATIELPPASGAVRRWDVPLLTVLGAEPFEGDVALRLAGIDLVRAETFGLHEGAAGARADTPAPWRTYRYGQGLVGLTLQVRVPPDDRSGEAVADNVRLATYLTPEGAILHHFQGVVESWQQTALPLRLPAGVRVLAARVDGKWISQPTTRQREEETILSLPVPAGGGRHDFELAYVGDDAAWTFWHVIDAPAPALPVRARAFRRAWHLPPGVVPLFAEELRIRAAVPATRDDTLADSLTPLVSQEAYTAWEPVAGAADASRLAIVGERGRGGLTLALLILPLLAGVWLWRAGPRVRLALLLGWLVAGVLGVIWLPDALRATVLLPALAAAAVATWWYVRPPFLPRPAVAAALLTAAVCTARAVSPAPHTVWLLPGTPDDPAGSALAPAELLDQLQALARRGAAGLRGPILVGARYNGRVDRGNAEFTAEFRTYAFDDETAPLSLALGSIELQEALLDGAAAYPVALPAPQTGYAIPVRGRGFHVLRVRFLIRLTSVGDGRELRFVVPDLAQNQFVFQAPKKAQYLHVLSCRGAAQVRDDDGPVLEVELGRIGTVDVRWREEPPTAAPALVQVREAYVWDVQAAASRLFGLMQYAVRRGAVTGLGFDLPEGLALRQVEAGPLPGAGPAPRLRDWRQEGPAGRRVRLEFQSPITEGIQVFLDMVPLGPLPPGGVLPLPVPHDPAPEEGLLAFRAEGVEAARVETRGLTSCDTEAFRRHWQAAEVDEPGLPDKAYTFRRAGGSAPRLALDLRSALGRGQCEQEAMWRLGPRQAEFRVTARLSDQDEDLILAAWDVPPGAVLADVTGPDVRSWSRSGNRLQVWFTRALGEASVTVNGWLPRHTDDTARFAPPRLHAVSARSQVDLVHVQAEEGLLLRPADTRHVLLFTPPDGPAREFTYRVERPDAIVTFYVLPDRSHVPATQAASENEQPQARKTSDSSEVIQVFLVEQTALVLDGRGWTHGGTYLLSHDPGTDLSLTLPAGAIVRDVAVDGVAVTPLQPASNRLWVALPASGGVRRVRVTWSFMEGESLARPILEQPRIAGVAEVPTLWTLSVPTGFGIAKASDELRADAAGYNLHRAAALLRVTAFLAAQNKAEARGSLTILQERFYRLLRAVERRSGTGAPSDDGGPDGHALGPWLQELREQNQQLSRAYHFEKVRAQAERQARSGSDPASGDNDAALLYGDSAAGAPAPVLLLYLEHPWQVRHAWPLTVIVLVLAAVSWTLGFFPHAAERVRRLWPEQTAAAGLLVWYLHGPLAVVFALLLVAACGRLLAIARWLQGRRPPAPTSSPVVP